MTNGKLVSDSKGFYIAQEVNIIEFEDNRLDVTPRQGDLLLISDLLVSINGIIRYKACISQQTLFHVHDDFYLSIRMMENILFENKIMLL